ncbi:MAG: hypothetical protein KBT36_11210 [Kurthia sp.]|nr:hypothetical protein [Candidatus Kurthia equi]
MSTSNNQSSITEETKKKILEEMEACRINYEHEKDVIEKTTRYWTKNTAISSIFITLIIVLLCSLSLETTLIGLIMQTVSSFLFNVTITLGMTMFFLKKIQKYSESDLDIPRGIALEERLQMLDENMKKSSKRTALSMTTLLFVFVALLFVISPLIINQFIEGTNLFVKIILAIVVWACMTPAIGELFRHNRERKAFKIYNKKHKLAVEKVFLQG